MSKLAKSTAQDIKGTASITKTSIDNLKKANANLKDELNAEMRLTTLTNVQVGSKIAKLQEKGTFYAKQIEVEAKKLSDLDAQIEMVQKAITAKRNMLQKNEGSSLETLGKQIKQLERKLDKNYQRHNEILCDNRQLKEEIDDLRRERATFDKIYKKLENDLEDKKRVLGEAFKNSENAKDKKKLSEEQIRKLKLKARKEESDIEKEFQNVLRDINEKNIVDRIEEKFGNLEKRTQVVKKREDDSPNRTTNTYMLDESRGMGDLTRSFAGKKHQKSVEKKPKEVEGKTPQEEVEEYRAVFENLKSRTGKSDLREILQLFEDYEKKNYSLYQHLTHLSNEKDELDKQILHVREELNSLSKSKANNREDGADNKNQKIQEIKDSIEDTNKHYQFLEDKQQGLIETINSLKISIPIIFERIGCNAEDYANELIDSTSVNEGNMLQYLAIIEKKTNEILQMYHFSQNRTEAGGKVQVDDKGKKGEESIVSGGNVFPEKELLADLLSVPEKADMQSIKDFQEYAKEKVKSLIEKKNTKSGAK